MKAEKNKFVSIHYTLKGDDGNVIDSSVGGQPLSFVMGQGYILPKLEAAIENHEVRDKIHADLEPVDGYGVHDESQVQEVSRSNFETDMPIEVGMAFQAMGPMGPVIVRVTKVTDDTITVDGNHELAGKNLHFDVEVVEVRDATEEELNPPSCGGGCGGCGGGCGGDCGSEGGCNCDGGCGGGCGCN